ncbi:uncharacterized protein AB675_8951 [Cyphellophora attinorum]|uniref:Uncharacterized protein n=1 Tax=Cyphellophora attinorum TaxID=1664694 RepID=A0A0N0NIT0_9EURO|nr:uncharacterized protein AB675_8951 [Phialophora attinorum]KPI36181.1 hypothetical protein AB675_8951 [Phialophora attinorum]
MTRSPSPKSQRRLINQWLTHIPTTEDPISALPEAEVGTRDHKASERRTTTEKKRRRASEFEWSGRRHKSPLDLEPVDAARLLSQEDDSGRREQGPRRKEKAQNDRHTRYKANNQSPDHVEPAKDSGQPVIDASEKYGRRKRHKTREDRYEYNAQHTTAEAKRESRAKEKRKSHRKTGSTLHKDFKAPNVESERLTLKQDALPGIFSKGKASGPIERRGIPDLTFSEMSFLNDKRQLDHAKLRGLQAVTHSGKKKKGGAEDVSGYFGEQGPEDHVHDPPHDNILQHPTGSPRPRLNPQTSPGRPPRLKTDDLVQQQQQQQQRAVSDRSVSKERLPPVQVFEDGAWFQRDRNSPDHVGRTQLSSHVSCSTSPSRRPAALTPHTRISLRRQSAVAPSSFVEQASRARVASVHPRSSASQSYPHLRNYGNIINDRDPGPGNNNEADSTRRYYTLEDLMLLADRRQAEPEKQVLQAVGDDDRGLLDLLEGLPHPPTSHHGPAHFNLYHPGLKGPDPYMMPQNDDEIQLGPAPGLLLRESTPSAPHLSYGEQRDSLKHAGVISRNEILELEVLYDRADSGTHLDNFDIGLLGTLEEQHTAEQVRADDYDFEHRAQPGSVHLPEDYPEPQERGQTRHSRTSRSNVDVFPEVSARPQLLRPSCEESSFKSPLKPFSRPRLLY